MTLARLAATAAAGGALGAGARAWLTEVAGSAPESTLAATLVINVVGCVVLAALPALRAVRRSRAWSVFLGTGLLGGFTTMSTAVALPVAALSPARALGYMAATLAIALCAVWLVRRLAPGPRGVGPGIEDGP